MVNHGLIVQMHSEDNRQDKRHHFSDRRIIITITISLATIAVTAILGFAVYIKDIEWDLIKVVSQAFDRIERNLHDLTERVTIIECGEGYKVCEGTKEDAP